MQQIGFALTLAYNFFTFRELTHNWTILPVWA